MGKSFITETFKIAGMTCVSCENRIERTLKNTRGVANAMVNWGKGTASVTYDPGRIGRGALIKVIEELGYGAAVSKGAAAAGGGRPTGDGIRGSGLQAAGVFVILIALYLIINRFGGFDLFNAFPQAKAGMGYGMLFVIGLLTSTHCIAMCGGINLSQCVPYQAHGNDKGKGASLMPAILYNSGRVVSYTVIGGLVGALGSIVSFGSGGKGVIALIAGIFMVIMGLNMLNVFPWLRRLNPRMPKVFAEKINDGKKSNRPLYVGLLNGLMPCGPLQAMQLYALSTGDPVQGAVSMLLFSLGTVPLMFGLGALSAVLTKRFTARMMTVSAALVILLGVFMLGNGMALAGYGVPLSAGTGAGSGTENASALRGEKAELVDGVQIVSTSLNSRRYEPIIVQEGIPVKWTIRAEAGDINGCNNRIVIPEYNLEKPLQPGDNLIEFTPDKSGVVPYSCWMGMIRSQIAVVDDLADTSRVPEADESINTQLPSCCGG